MAGNVGLKLRSEGRTGGEEQGCLHRVTLCLHLGDALGVSDGSGCSFPSPDPPDALEKRAFLDELTILTLNIHQKITGDSMWKS